MKAAVLRQFRMPLSIEERPKPDPHGEEVLVRVRAAGVCHTDLHLQDGCYPDLPLPRILGHEITGQTEQMGDVIIYASWGCGICQYCRSGNEQLCLKACEPGWLRDGGYAEYVLVPSRRYLLPLQGLDPMRAAPLADAGVTPYRAVHRVLPWLQGDGSLAVVIGVGGLGQFAIQYLRLFTNARVIAVDRSKTKLVRALELGATAAVLPGEVPRSVRVVLDFVGSAETLLLASEIVERGGIVVQIGEANGKIGFGLGFVPHEAAFTTSIWGSQADLQAVLECALRGELKWHVEAVPLEDANKALDRLRRGDVTGRLVLTP